MKQSKSTMALLAQFPGFDDWIINNLTPNQLLAVMQTRLGVVGFGEAHPLNSRELGVQLWRAYRYEVVFELNCRWGDDENHAIPPLGCNRFAYFHEAVCDAIKLFARAQPELLKKTVERQRSEIEVSTGPAQSPPEPAPAAERRNRL